VAQTSAPIRNFTALAPRKRLCRVKDRIAFDLDGTLIDARHRQVGVATEALASATGERLDEARFWRAKRSGANTRDALTRLGYYPATAADVAQRWAQRIEADDWLDGDRALPGVKRVLTDLQDGGAVICVVTARRSAEGARRSLLAAGIEPLIAKLIVVAPAMVVTAKARALRRWGAAGFIGDTESDGLASRSAGVPFAAVTTGQRSRGYLSSRGYAPAKSLSEALAALALAGRSRQCRPDGLSG
jgi:phosphoglycolate phosphatase-like HAD superfamily hydrolase